MGVLHFSGGWGESLMLLVENTMTLQCKNIHGCSFPPFQEVAIVILLCIETLLFHVCCNFVIHDMIQDILMA